MSKRTTLEEATNNVCISLREQIRQLQFMEETQGRTFAEQVKANVKAAGKVKKR